MTPSAQPGAEQGQGVQSSEVEHKELPDVYAYIDSQQGSMAPPSAFSSDQLIDPQMSLDPSIFSSTDDSVGSDPTQSTHPTDKYKDTSLILPSTEDNSNSLIKTKDTSLILPSTEDNSNSLIKTKEFLEFWMNYLKSLHLCQIGRVHLNMMTLSLRQG